jgi:hypothetical protein
MNITTAASGFHNLQLRKACFSDLSSIAAVWTDAFFDDELIGDIMHPHRKQYPRDVYWFLLRGIRERFWNWRHQFMVVTIKDGNEERIIGAADWRRLGNGGKARELWGLDPSEYSKPFPGEILKPVKLNPSSASSHFSPIDWSNR